MVIVKNLRLFIRHTSHAIRIFLEIADKFKVLHKIRLFM